VGWLRSLPLASLENETSPVFLVAPGMSLGVDVTVSVTAAWRVLHWVQGGHGLWVPLAETTLQILIHPICTCWMAAVAGGW